MNNTLAFIGLGVILLFVFVWIPWMNYLTRKTNKTVKEIIDMCEKSNKAFDEHWPEYLRQHELKTLKRLKEKYPEEG